MGIVPFKTKPSGLDGELQFNDGGKFGSSSALTFNKTTGVLSTTALALGGATLGSNALAVTGTSLFGGALSVPNSATAVNNAAETNSSYGFVLGTPTIHKTGNIIAVFGAVGPDFAGRISIGATGSPDALMWRDAANTLAQRNGPNAQESRLYANYASATDFHRVTTKFAKTTLSGVTGASVTATNLIPAGAILKGLSTKVTTGLGVTGGTTGYQVGDGSDPDRWGAITGTAAGTSSDNRNWTAGGERFFAAANSVVITAVGGNFDGTGVIDVVAAYDTGECD